MTLNPLRADPSYDVEDGLNLRYRKGGGFDGGRSRGGGRAGLGYRALQNHIRELHRLLGKKTLEAEILREALEVAAGPRCLVPTFAGAGLG